MTPPSVAGVPAPAIVVRRATPADYQRVADIITGSYAAAGDLTPDDPYWSQLCDTARRDREAEVWVAQDSSGVVGTVTWCPLGSPWAEVAGEGEIEFRMLAVDPAQQRRGIARTLVSWIIDRARAEGAPAVVLSSGPWMTNAHRLYESMGFVHAPELDWTPRPDLYIKGYRYAL